MRRKPRGIAGSSKVISGQAPAFSPVILPESKAKLESSVCFGALRSQRNVGLDLWRCRAEPVQLAEADFDFALDTSGGREYLDLVEFAPLAPLGGEYNRAPATTKNGDVADQVWELIAKKSEHYGGLRGIKVHLFIYSTDFRFRLGPSVIALLAIRSSRTAHGFQSIAHYTPLSAEVGWIQAVFGDGVPVPPVSSEEEEHLRAGEVTVFDLRSPQVTDDGLGLTFG